MLRNDVATAPAPVAQPEPAPQEDEEMQRSARADPPPITRREVERQVSRGLVALGVRQVLAYGVLFLGNVYLSRHLTDAEYGFFAAVLAIQAALVVLGDLGLGAALVQQAEEPTPHELTSLFTVQLLLFTTLALGTWLIAPTLAARANLLEGAPVIRALGVILCLSAFRSIPAMQLLRRVRFNQVALVEVTSTVLYQVVLIALVWRGLGVQSLVWALAVKYSVDLLLILYFQPWQPRLTMDLRATWPFLRFGLAMQGVSLLAYTKDQLPLIFLVPLMGLTSAGHWGWALSYIAMPVYFNRLVDRLMFPAYARVQHDPEAVGSMAETGTWLDFALGVPILMVLILFAQPLIPLIYAQKWLVTLPILWSLVPNMLGNFMTGALFQVLYGTGRTRRALGLFTVWVVLMLIGSVIGVYFAGLVGLGIAYSVVTGVVCVLLRLMIRPAAHMRLRAALPSPLIAGGGGAAIALALLHSPIPWPLALVASLLTYSVLLLALGRHQFQGLWHNLRAA